MALRGLSQRARPGAARRGRRAVGIVAPAGLCAVLALAGCGSSTSSGGVSHAKVSATAYVTSLCEAVAPLEQEILKARALETARNLSPTDGKRVLVSYLGALSHDGSSAVSRLRSAGVPDVQDGASFSTSVLSTFTRLSGTLGRTEMVARNLSTSSQAVYHAGATNLATAVKESIGEIGQSFSTRPSKALNAAAQKVSACHQL